MISGINKTELFFCQVISMIRCKHRLFFCKEYTTVIAAIEKNCLADVERDIRVKEDTIINGTDNDNSAWDG